MPRLLSLPLSELFTESFGADTFQRSMIECCIIARKILERGKGM